MAGAKKTTSTKGTSSKPDKDRSGKVDVVSWGNWGWKMGIRKKGMVLSHSAILCPRKKPTVTLISTSYLYQNQTKCHSLKEFIITIQSEEMVVWVEKFTFVGNWLAVKHRWERNNSCIALSWVTSLMSFKLLRTPKIINTIHKNCTLHQSCGSQGSDAEQCFSNCVHLNELEILWKWRC